MKIWKKTLTPKQVRFLLYNMCLECSGSTIFRHSKKFDWELTNDKSYDDWKDDYYTIKVLKNGKFFEAITPNWARKVLAQ